MRIIYFVPYSFALIPHVITYTYEGIYSLVFNFIEVLMFIQFSNYYTHTLIYSKTKNFVLKQYIVS